MAEAMGARLGIFEAVQFPESLVRLWATGVELLTPSEALLPRGPLSAPLPEFGILGPDLIDYFDNYEFAAYMPGAVP